MLGHAVVLARGFKVTEGSENFKLINEAFPHIGEKLKFSWGQDKFKTYIDALKNETRRNAGAGLPREILNALFYLSLDDEKEHPNLTLKQTDPWSRWRWTSPSG